MYQQGWKLDEQNGRIRICKKWYKYFQSRNIEGKVKTVTVKRDGVSALGGEPLSAVRFTTSTG